VVYTVASVGDRGVIAYERTARELYSGLPHGAGDGAAGRPGATGALPGETVGTGSEGWDTGAPDDTASASDGNGTAGAGEAGDASGGGLAPAEQGGGAPGAHVAGSWGNDATDPPDTAVHVAPPNVDAPAPETGVWVDQDGESGATVDSDETETSGQVALNRQIAEDGEIVTQEVDSQVADTPVTLDTFVYTNDFSVCHETMVC
jgi:hypothetical protein